MELNTGVKTLFSIYRVLDKLAGSIDKMVKMKAFGCMVTRMENLAFNGTLKVSEDINNLTNKKINLINLKIITTNILKNIDKDFARLIIMKYIENKKYLEISETLHISTRTAIRWHNAGIKQSVYQLKKMSLPMEKIENIFQKEKWILSVYSNLATEMRAENRKYNEFEILNKACKEYKSLC